MRIFTALCGLAYRVRLAPSPGEESPNSHRHAKGSSAAPPPPRPALAPKASKLMQIEREVLERFRPQMRHALQDELDAFSAAQGNGPDCCLSPMRHHDTRTARWLTWVGWVEAKAWRYRCATCGAERRPLLEELEVEPGPLTAA